METEKKEVNGKIRTVGTVVIEYEGQNANVELMKLTFGEDLNIRNRHTKIKILSGQPDIKIDQENLTLDNLKTAIIKAPFEITIDGIKDLDKDVAEIIMEGFNELNNPAKKKDMS